MNLVRGAVAGGVLAVAHPILPRDGEQRMTVGLVARHFGEIEREVGISDIARAAPTRPRMDGDRVLGPRPVDEHVDETGPAQARRAQAPALRRLRRRTT